MTALGTTMPTAITEIYQIEHRFIPCLSDTFSLQHSAPSLGLSVLSPAMIYESQFVPNSCPRARYLSPSYQPTENMICECCRQTFNATLVSNFYPFLRTHRHTQSSYFVAASATVSTAVWPASWSRSSASICTHMLLLANLKLNTFVRCHWKRQN